MAGRSADQSGHGLTHRQRALCSNIATSTPPKVRRTRYRLGANRIDNTGVVQPFEQGERVAASDCYRVRLFYYGTNSTNSTLRGSCLSNA
jgi:hypothetical protein